MLFVFFGEPEQSRLNKKDGIVDMNGKEVLPCIFDLIQPYGNVLKVKLNDK